MSRIAALVLAAGLSRRYGADDKLAALIDSKPLAGHIAATLAAVPFVERIAVCSAQQGLVPDAFRSAGFTVLNNPAPEEGQGHSLAIGASYAASLNVDGLLVALADMPFVSASHIEIMVSRFQADRALCSAAGHYRGPPALFPRSQFSALTAMAGDTGARKLLVDALSIAAEARELRDFDIPADFIIQPNGN